MIPVSTLVEITDGLSIGLPASVRMSQERSVLRPDINRYYLTPVVIAASSWHAASRPALELAQTVTDDICSSYPNRLAASDCEAIGRDDHSGAAARTLAHFDWETDGGRLVRSHIAVFAGGDGDVAVMHLTVPQRLADETSSLVNQLIESARYEPRPNAAVTNPQTIPAAAVAVPQGVIAP